MMKAMEKHVLINAMATSLPPNRTRPRMFATDAASMKNVIYIRTEKRFLAMGPEET